MSTADVHCNNLQIKTLTHFIKHSAILINDHLAYQDEELAMHLFNMMDVFKSSGIDSVSDAAFEADMKIKYNIG